MSQDNSQEQQLKLLSELLALHPLTPLPENFTEQQSKEIDQALSHPSVLLYFRMLANNSVRDVMALEFEHDDAKAKLSARFNKLKGVLYVCFNVISTYDKRKA